MNQLTTTSERIMRQVEAPTLNALMTEVMADTPYIPEADVTVQVFELKEDDRNEVLAFLRYLRFVLPQTLVPSQEQLLSLGVFLLTGQGGA